LILYSCRDRIGSNFRVGINGLTYS